MADCPSFTVFEGETPPDGDPVFRWVWIDIDGAEVECTIEFAKIGWNPSGGNGCLINVCVVVGFDFRQDFALSGNSKTPVAVFFPDCVHRGPEVSGRVSVDGEVTLFPF